MGELVQRKSTRLKNFDYSSVGAYFVTICTKDRKQILSDIVMPRFTAKNDLQHLNTVGEGLATPETEHALRIITDTPWVRLKSCGRIAEEQLLLLEKRYSNVTVENYVIMPDHIHAIIFLHEVSGGASPSPTLDNVICAYKSLTSRMCKQLYGIEKMFQRSYMEHIIRDRSDYEAKANYIHDNPISWYYKSLSTNE